jgi:hypothetical protein
VSLFDKLDTVAKFAKTAKDLASDSGLQQELVTLIADTELLIATSEKVMKDIEAIYEIAEPSVKPLLESMLDAIKGK